MVIEDNVEVIKEETDVVTYESKDIKSLIYTIRGKQVMLDSDVAMLYQYKTKNINKAMKRNIERFPEDFCFQLTEEEILCLRSQIVTLGSEEKNVVPIWNYIEKRNRKLEVPIWNLKFRK